ncbi:DUF922 domain-containing protein [Chryseobacterium aureum]|uniref:DUF922 domain-containing protein n=1 Tax=Chryseobacterium aureum TaxID=2497456 RepID=UPI000F86DDC5|nr:DUF922 domain-containing protein [Chryseobacterium aureum]
MMNKLLIVFLLSSQALLSQAITWSPDRKLDFKDFTNNMPEEDDSKGAESYIEIDYKIVSTSIWTGRIKIKVSATFYPEKSWFNKKYITAGYILNHEQKHFDIAYIFANRLQNIINTKIKGTNDFNNNFQKLYDENFNEYSTFQAKYDSDTEHGANLEQQKIYDTMIEEMINDASKKNENK